MYCTRRLREDGYRKSELRRQSVVFKAISRPESLPQAGYILLVVTFLPTIVIETGSAQ